MKKSGFSQRNSGLQLAKLILLSALSATHVVVTDKRYSDANASANGSIVGHRG